MSEITEKVEPEDPRRAQCKESDCGGSVEANPALYLSAWADGSWSISGVGDNEPNISCDASGHENWTEMLDKSMTAFLETVLPGTTWEGSNPQHPLGQGTVTVQFSIEAFRALRERAPDLLQFATIIHQGRIHQ